MAAWITGAELLSYAGATLKVAVADLPTLWTTISGQAAALGQADITGVMTTKGYTPDVLDEWDERVALALSQGLYRLGAMGGGYGDYDKEWFKQFDLCAKDGILVNFGVVIIDNVATAPAGSTVGGVMHGSNTSGSLARRNWCRIGSGLSRQNPDGTYGDCGGCR